jgi:hypothetical protein
MLLRYSKIDEDRIKQLKPLNIYDLSADQAAISASIFKSSSNFKSNASFKDLIVYFKSLQKQIAESNRFYTGFKNSKKNIDKIENTYKWDLVKLILLENSMLKSVDLIDKWTEDNALVGMCSANSENPSCWKIQQNISSFITSSKKNFAQIDLNLEDFVKYNNYDTDLLYIDEDKYKKSIDNNNKTFFIDLKTKQKIFPLHQVI